MNTTTATSAITTHLQTDIENVTGNKPQLNNQENLPASSKQIVIIGTLGKNKLIDVGFWTLDVGFIKLSLIPMTNVQRLRSKKIQMKRVYIFSLSFYKTALPLH